MNEKTDKAFRLLRLHERLNKGESINKSAALAEFDIPAKTFQRDIDRLRQYYSEYGSGELVYDRKNDRYHLQTKAGNLTKEEVFAVCKVLIESRAFNKIEFERIITKLLQQCEAAEAKNVNGAIGNERVNYLQLHHGKSVVDKLWRLAEFVTEQCIIKITYNRSDGTLRSHEVKPVGIMFSEFYFYLIAYMADDSKQFPTVFRVDRTNDIKAMEQHFSVPYAEKFNESEFRKRVQFMYSGELRIVRFLFKGVLEAVLDRLPTAMVEKEMSDGAIIRAEVFGNGVDMWLRSQGDKVEIL